MSPASPLPVYMFSVLYTLHVWTETWYSDSFLSLRLTYNPHQRCISHTSLNILPHLSHEHNPTDIQSNSKSTLSIIGCPVTRWWGISQWGGGLGLGQGGLIQPLVRINYKGQQQRIGDTGTAWLKLLLNVLAWYMSLPPFPHTSILPPKHHLFSLRS